MGSTIPVISPNSRYLAYWTLEGPLNRTLLECWLGCAGYYQILDLVTQENIDLYPFFYGLAHYPETVHCSPMWSPSGRFLSFYLGGCGHMRAEGIMIFDAQNKQVAATIQPSVDIQSPSIVQWISDTDILYTVSIPREFDDRVFYLASSYFVYSINDHASYELINLSPFTNTSQDILDIRDSSLTQDKEFLATKLVGITEMDEPSHFLAIINLGQDPYTINYLSSAGRFSTQPGSVPFLAPQWSPSGKWLAYRSRLSDYTDDDGVELSHTVHIINKDESQFFEMAFTSFRYVHFAWISN